MKLRLPQTLFRALMACFAALVSSSLASASGSASTSVTLKMVAPDVEQTDTMLCWAASAADILAMESGQDATAIYRCITEASGNTPGYVESALSWYKEGAEGTLQPQAFDGSHTITRHHFDSLYALANSLDEALKESRAASLTLYASGDKEGTGHAVTVYASQYEGGRLYFSYVDSADGVPGVQRAEIIESEQGFVLDGTDYVIGSLTYMGEDGAADEAPGAPVGAYIHSSPLYQEYSDLAENRGVYRFAYMPSVIMYQNGEENYYVNITPDYSVVSDAGCFTLVNHGSFQVTVEHNGVMGGWGFSSRFIGSENAQVYNCVGIRYNQTFVFGWSNPFVPTGDDFKIERMSRLVTDANSTAWCADNTRLSNLDGTMYFRVGAGRSGYFDQDGNVISLSSAWGYGLTAGIGTLNGGWFSENNPDMYHMGDSVSDFVHTSATTPLPSATQSGDSGSPVFVYNEETGQFELISCLQGGSTYSWGTRYNGVAISGAIDFCEVSVGMDTNYNASNADATTYYISGARVGLDDTLISNDGAAAYLRKGTITLNGETVAEYNGISLDEFWDGTWKLLDADNLKWFTYSDNDYLNAAFSTATDASTFGQDDLFYTSNINMVAKVAGTTRIELTEDVDLGIGYVQFSLGEGVESATFDLAKDSSEYLFSNAGFIIDAGVTVNNYITYEKGRELRRVGEGVMNIVGEGNNDVLLNLGGGGTTLLARTNGYGAYSALLNTKAVLSLADADQVYNNVTIGSGGGALDFHGNDYRWTSGGARAEGSDGHTYFGLTVYEGINRVENSYLANYASGTSSTITIERTDDFEFAGAFRDGSSYSASTGQSWDSRYTMMPSLLIDSYYQFQSSERVDSDSVLKVVYDGGATMTMTGVYTVLTGSNSLGESGFEVASGNVVLRGTNTIHAIGSESGTNTNRLQVADDWHYAMAEMDVTVANGASFELGHHALLIGDVTVENGGTFTMKQAVNQRYEYVEGWYVAEDTYALSDYYGLKGNVSLESGASMDIRFDEGVATALTYGGNITGAGSLTVAAGAGSVKLTGSNDFSGEKTVESGNLRLANGAEGDTTTNKWLIQEQGSLALEAVSSNADVLAHVDAASTGVLALTQNLTEQVTLAGLIVGAAEGETVHYGTADKALTAVDGTWTLGGGGGTLYVDFQLTGANTLVLGNEYGTGTVVLTNELNTFSGGIDIVGDITLEYTSLSALGAGGSLSLNYGNVLNALSNEIITAGKLTSDADGVYALKDGTQDYDLSHYSSLALGATGEVTFTGALTLADGAAYRFGGSGALTIDTALSGAHDIVIDGQGNPGSSVIFAKASTATGAVLVQGYADTARSISSGDVTLSFTTDNALASASSVTLKNDSGVNLNGTNQTFNNLSIEQGSLIFDDKGGNTLTLHYNNGTEHTYESDMHLALTSIVKTGTDTVTLSGSNAWAGMDIQAGVVKVTSDAALGGNTSVQSGATLHITNWSETAHEVAIDIAGSGASGQSGALVFDSWHANSKATVNVTSDATIYTGSGFSLGTINLKGNDLTIKGNGGHFSVGSSIVGDGGSITADNIHLRSLYGSNYNLTVTGGGSLNIDGYSGGSTIGITLNNANFNMSNGGIADSDSTGSSTFYGTITVGNSGATISNSAAASRNKEFNLAGMITGTGTLNLISGNGKTINLQGGMDLDATLSLGWGVNVNVTKHAEVNALTGSGSLTVADSTLEIDGTGTNYEGTLTLSGEGHLQLTGQNGSSMGSISTLAMGDSGVLTFANLSGYTSNAMLNVGSVTGSKVVAVDVASLSGLSSGTYQLLSGSSESFDGWTLANTTTNSRIGLALVAGGSAGSYTLSLAVTQGTLQTVTWAGTGTLYAGTVDSTHISSTAGDYQFLSFDHLVITSNSGDDHTLTLGETIYASSVTYSGSGTVSLGDNTAAFAEGVGFTLDGTGRFEVDDTEFNPGSEWGTKAITGDVLLKQGTLAASTYSLNAMNSITVTGTAAIELINPDSSETGRLNNTIQIDKDAKLTLTTLSEWGGTMSGALAGEGALVIENKDSLTLLGDNSAFTGSLTVNSGTVNFGNSGYSDFSMGASSITMADGTTLVFKSTYTEYTADFTWGNATLYVQEGSGDGPDPTSVGYLLSGKQILNGTLTYQTNWGKVTHFSGDIEGTGGIDFSSTNSWGGSPAVVLSGNNSYSGGTSLNNSRLTLYAGSQNAFGTGALNLNAGALSWTGIGGDWTGDLSVSSIVLGGGAMNTYGQNVTLSTPAISGSGALIKQGDGTLTLSGTLSYTGATVVEGGELVLGSQLASTAGITVNKATILRVQDEYLNGNTVNLVSSLGGKVAQVIGTANALSSAGEYVISSGGNAMGVGYIGITEGGSFTKNISGTNGALLMASPETTYVQGIISGDLSVSMAGNFMLLGANTYTGGTELTEGKLQIGSASALGSGPLVAHSGTVEVLVEATIAGDSYINDLVFSESGKVVVGSSTEAGSLMFDKVTGNASFALDIFAEDSYDYLMGDLDSATIDVTIKANTIGTYELVQGSVGTLDSFTLSLSGKDENTYSYSWGASEEGLTLTIDYKTGSVNLWTGKNNDVWDATSTTAWNNSAYNNDLALTVMRVSQDTDITVSAAVGAASTTDGTATTFRVETTEGANLTFTSNGDSSSSIISNTLLKEGDGTLTFNAGLTNSFGSVVINEGTVSIAAGGALGTTTISGEGTFELAGGSMSVGSTSDFSVENISLVNSSLTVDGGWGGITLDSRTLTIGKNAQLMMGHWGNINNSVINLTDGGTLAMNASGFSNNEIVVEGSGTYAVGDTTNAQDACTLNTTSNFSGNGTLTITEYDAYRSGVATLNMNGVITDGENGSLALKTDINALNLSGANTYSGGTTIAGGTVTTSNASALGTGAVTMTGGTLTLSSALNIGTLSGTGGTIERGTNDLTINQTEDGTFDGTVNGSGSLTKKGEGALSLSGTGAVSVNNLTLEAGSLSIAGAVTVNGTYTQAAGTTASYGALTLGVVNFDMNQGSALSVAGALTLGSGSTLSYSSTTDYTKVGSIAVSGGSALTLSVSDSVLAYLTGTDGSGNLNTYDLGADLSASTLTLSGHDSGTYKIVTGADGHSYLQLTSSNIWVQNYVTVDWDANWNLAASAPEKAWKLSLSETTGLYGNSSVDNGERVVATVYGTSSTPTNVFALLNAASETEAGSSLTRDAWLEVTDGTFGVIAGANLNNWNSSAAWNIEGDIHIMLNGGSANEVIGLTYADGKNPTFTGDSYVSIGSGATVHDSVIGGGVLRHAAGITLNGNTYVVVNGVLSELASSLTGDGISTLHNAVIGGHAYGQGGTGAGVRGIVNGNTNVLVNLTSDQSGTFAKTIIGGNDVKGDTGLITGNASVTINAGSGVEFSNNIVGGSSSSGETETIEGDSTLIINGGTYSGGTGKFLIGGSWVTGGTSTIGGTASIILGGDAVINRHVFVAGYAADGESTVASTLLEIGGGVTIGNGIKLSGGFTSSSKGTVTGAQTLALGDGVDLSSSTATLERFNRIEVAEGSAKLDVSKFVNLSEYTKTGAGTLNLTGTIGYAESNVTKLTVAGGTVALSSAYNLNNNGDTSNTAVTISAGRLSLDDDLSIGSLSGGDGGVLDLVNGHALTINQTTSGTFRGSLEGVTSFTKNGTGGFKMTNTEQTYNLTSLTVNAGDLILAGDVKLSGALIQADETFVRLGSLAMSGVQTLAMGELTIDGDLTMVSGSTLSYASVGEGTGAGGTFSLTGGNALTLNVTEAALNDLSQGSGYYDVLDLGVTLTDSMKSSATVTGLSDSGLSYAFGTDASTGHTTLVITDSRYIDISWDSNWGSAVLDGAPTRAQTVTLSANTGFYGDSAHDNGSSIEAAISATTASSPINVYATVDGSSNTGGGTVTQDAWLQVTGGTYGIIAGLNNAGSSTWNVNGGDIHIQVSGGTVNDIVGYSSYNTSGTTLTGNTYVSVMEGATVYDSVIGGGVMTNGKTANITGNTNVYIYDVLNTSPDTLTGDAIGTRYNAVIGGLASGTNNGESWTLSGNTNVTVDLTAYTGSSDTFVKAIYGGNVSSYQWGNINGNTNVLIDANNNVTFTNNIVAGSRQNGNTGVVRIYGDSTLTINGGVFEGTGVYLTGGNYVDGSEALLSGQAAVIINGGTINRDVYAAGISGDNASSTAITVGSSLVYIGKDATLGSDITVSGGFGGSTGRGTVSGSKTLSFGDGVDLSASTASFKDFDSVKVESGNASVAASTLSNLASVNKTGAGTLTLNGRTTQTVTLTEGTLAAATSGLTIGGLSADSAAASSLLLTGNLTINQTGSVTYAGGLSGEGTLTMAGAGELTLSGSYLEAGVFKTTAGALHLTGSHLAAGTLTVAGGSMEVNSITLSDSLNMNQSGLSITTLTMAANATLEYSSAEGYTSITNFSAKGALTLSLTDELINTLKLGDGSYDSLNLGLTLADTSNVSVDGFEANTYGFETDANTGYTLLKLYSDDMAAYYGVTWDKNWGVSGPEKVWHTTVDAPTGFYGNEKYDDGTTIAVSVIGNDSSEAVNLYATTSDGSSVSRDAWLEISGGSYSTIAGSSGGSITGDMHIMISGGTVENIVGFNASSANGAPTHTGDSYITVGEGVSVTDSIFGAGVSTNGNGGTLKGDTNIFVYEVLSDGTASTGTASNTSTWNYNAIVGGFARTLGYGVNFSIEGSTNVTIDVSDDSGTFVKNIFGGNVSERFSHIGSISGNSTVSIAAADEVLFTGNIVAGGLKGGDEWGRVDYIKGDTRLTIDGGTYESGGYLTAGSVVSGGTSAIGGSLSTTGDWGTVTYTSAGGTAAVILNGGVINRDIYASGISNGGTSYVENSLVEINSGVTLGSGITVSGGFGGSGGTTYTMGTRTLAFGDGVNLASSTVTFTDFDSVQVASGNAAVEVSTLDSLSSITKTGEGTLTLNGSTDNTVNLSAGTLALGSDLTLGGLSGVSGTAVTMGSYALTLNTADDLTHAGSVTGSGNITMAGSGSQTLSGSVQTSGDIKATAGSLTLSGDGASAKSFTAEGGSLTLSGANATAETLTVNSGSMSITGSGLSAGTLKVTSGSMTLTGTGASAEALEVSGGSMVIDAITLTGDLAMNQSGLSITTLTMADGTTLSYTSETGYATIGSVTGAGTLTLSMTENLMEYLTTRTADGSAFQSLDLGTTLTAGSTNVSLAGLDSGSYTYTIGTNESGHSTLQLTSSDYDVVDWDANWGDELQSAPTGKTLSTNLLINTALSDSIYDDGSRIFASVKGTDSTLDLFATVNLSDTGDSAVSLKRDAWVEITGGSYGVIAGALFNNYDNAASTIEGDLHYQMTGGSANAIIGFSYKDAKHPTLTGSTYISVYEGATINDSIIGGSELYHNAGATITGSTNIFIYDVLDTNPATLSGSATNLKNYAVIGGHAFGTNTWGNTAAIEGSTNILVDVSEYDGSATNFVKSIYGGNLSASTDSWGLAGSIGEGTHVDIEANELVTFTADIVAGSKVTWSEDISGGTSLTIDGGIYASGAVLTGGSYVTGGTSTIEGGVSMTLNGGTFNRDVYAAGYSTDGTSTVDSTQVEITSSSVSFGEGVTLSGGFGGTGGTTSVTGTRTLSLVDGVNLSDVTVKDFDTISVTRGSATVNSGNLGSLTKQGGGALALTAGLAEGANLSVEAGSLTVGANLALGNLSGAAGTTVDLGGHNLSITQSTEGSYAGSLTNVGSLTKAGDAALTLSDVSLSGTLSMSQSSLTITTLTVGDGATLAYSSMTEHSNVGSFTAQGALTLDVANVGLENYAQADGTFTALNLGVTLASTDSVTVSGLASTQTYSFGTDDSGKTTLQISDSNYSSVSWDSAWLATSAPEKAWHTTLSSTTGYYNSGRYDSGTDIVVSVGSTSADSPLDLYATANLSGVWDSAVNLNRNAWVEVTGGTYGIIAGAHFNNWGNSASSIVGDLHFQMSGGSVNDIIGFSYMDAKGPSLTGSTYISVYDGVTVNDSIIGGSELQHESGASITGNTNIFIYGVLGSNPDELTGTTTHERYNAVIGGHAFGTNQWSDPMFIDGSTNITVDVADTLSGDFVKSIIGGHMMGTGDGWNGSYSNVGTITKGTHVSLDAGSAVNFTADIAAGSKVVANNSDTISGGTALTISGGTYASGAILTGGSWNTGGTSIINGTASVTIDGGSINRDVYAAGYTTAYTEGDTPVEGASTVENASLTIGSGATLGSAVDAVAGGYLSSGSFTITGDSTLTINGGTYDGGTGYFLIGGNWVEGGTSIIEGTASVVLNGGTINRHVYAAGYSAGGTSTVAASRLEIASGVTIGDGIHLSGGFTTGANGTVTGDRTLALADGVNLSSMGSTLESFDHFEVNSGTATLGTNTFTSITSYSKTGEGTLKLMGTAKADATAVSVDGGTLELESGYALASGGTVSAAVTVNNGTLKLDSATTVSNTITFAGAGDMKVAGETLTLSGTGDSDFSYTGTGSAVVDATIQSAWANRLVFNVASAGKGDDFVELTVNGVMTNAGTEEYGLDKNGAGTLMLTAENKFAWGFNINAGRVIAASESALGIGSIDVKKGASLEIAAGTQVLLHHHINMAEGSELIVHELSTETAALTTDGSRMNWDTPSSLNALTLTLAADIELTAQTGYKVISLESGGAMAGGVDATTLNVNYLGNGRFNFSTYFSGTTLYLDATQDSNTTLVWDGTASESVWNQSAINTNWNREDTSAADSFMNDDSVSFTSEAANKVVTVADSGVQVSSMTVESGATGYEFTGGEVKAAGATLNESVELSGGASLALGEVFTVKQNVADVATVVGAVTMTSDKTIGKGAIVAAGTEIAGLDNAVIEIAAGGKALSLEDVLISESSSVSGAADGTSSLLVKDVTLKLGDVTTLQGIDGDLLGGTMLTQVGAGGSSFLLEESATVSTLFSSALANVTVSGTSLTIDLSNFADALVEGADIADYVAISFGEGEATSVVFEDLANMTIRATYDGGKSYAAVYVASMAQQSVKASTGAEQVATMASTLYISTKSIPEPTTATLSLLALSLLAARRRRRD